MPVTSTLHPSLVRLCLLALVALLMWPAMHLLRTTQRQAISSLCCAASPALQARQQVTRQGQWAAVDRQACARLTDQQQASARQRHAALLPDLAVLRSRRVPALHLRLRAAAEAPARRLRARGPPAASPLQRSLA